MANSIAERRNGGIFWHRGVRRINAGLARRIDRGMVRPGNDLPAVYLCRDSIDFRKGINGLVVLVEEVLQQDPFSEQLFVFCNRKRDKLKALYWKRNGFCLW